MGLKILNYGMEGSGKTAFAVTLSEVGNIGVVDTESRWQFYTEPHPTAKPKKPSDAKLAAAPPEIKAVLEMVYANPRRIRQDVPWLPRNDNIIWLVQTLDPSYAWEVSKIWARDKSICGQVQDSRSVIWDLLGDTRKTHSASGKELGGLAWEPVKKTDRRMNYTLIEGEQHFVLNAHKQELMNSKMEVIGTRAWAEKRTGHWIDLTLLFATSSISGLPCARVEKEKILGGLGGALKLGTILDHPNFKQILALSGLQANVAPVGSIDAILERTDKLVNQIAASPVIQGVDTLVGE